MGFFFVAMLGIILNVKYNFNRNLASYPLPSGPFSGIVPREHSAQKA
jgi:hypothetical protein